MSSNPTPPPNNTDQPDWMNDIQKHADEILGDLDSDAACDQVHPVIAKWYDEELEKEPPDSRPAVWQAMSCLTTELLMDAESDESLQGLFEAIDEDALAMWVEHILMVGRAMEISLRNGDLDDL